MSEFAIGALLAAAGFVVGWWRGREHSVSLAARMLCLGVLQWGPNAPEEARRLNREVGP